MTYVNPYQLLEKLNGGPLPDFERPTLMLVRKKAFAELELGGNATLALNNRTYSKNDLLQFFDGLQNPNELGFHAAISADPVLLQFLTEGKLHGNGRFKKTPVYGHADFLDFVSPFFEASYTPLMINSMKQRDTRTMGDMRVNPLLMNGEYRSRAFERVQRPLKNYVLQLREITAKYKQDKASLSAVMSPPLTQDVEDYAGIYPVAFLNLLPDEDYGPLRDDYAVAVFNLSAAIVGAYPRKALSFITNLRQLKLGDSRHEEIEERYKVLTNHVEALDGRVTTSAGARTQPASRSGNGAISAGRVVIIVIVILRFLLLLLSHH